jgi:hypothetical protein
VAECRLPWASRRAERRRSAKVTFSFELTRFPKLQVKTAPEEQASNASKDAGIASLHKRIKEQTKEIQELKQQLEVAYGRLYQQ